ncbi:MAG: hypothetical protein GDA56_32645 [Hormoscilla sp. GM7CHS1pb]|nr:hypothetical protein [Hormoscilla sp. GM7CHS1pb]
MASELQRIVPAPQPEMMEILEAHQVTREFYQELQYREEFERYCDWYYLTAQQNQQELQQMRSELNIFGWFLGKRRTQI